MMLTDLPRDLAEEILFRVPATSVKRFGSSCKRWNAFVKEPRFTEKHFGNAPRQPRVLMKKEDRFFSVSVDLNVAPPSIEIEDALSLKDSHSNSSKQVDIAKVFHCDGLLLCVTKDNRLVVWNPCSGETRWMQHEKGYERNSMFALGYQNNQSFRSYKALMFSPCWDGQVGGFEIYEFSSNSWRVVNTPNCVRIIGQGVTLKGNTYWIAEDINEDEYNNEDEYLLSFDFTRENFRRLYLPQPSQNSSYMALSVVREEQLSVLHFGSSMKEIWVTKKIDTTEADLSWRKSFAMDLNSIRGCVFTSLLIEEEKKVALSCGSNVWKNRTMVYTIGEVREDNEYYTEFPDIKSWWPFIFNYVPSLVQIESK